MDICRPGGREKAGSNMEEPHVVSLVFKNAEGRDGAKIHGVEFENIFGATRAWGLLPNHRMRNGEPCLNSGGKAMHGLVEGGVGAWGLIRAFCDNPMCLSEETIAKLV